MLVYLGTLKLRTCEVQKDAVALKPVELADTVYFRLDDEAGGAVVWRLSLADAIVLAEKIERMKKEVSI